MGKCKLYVCLFVRKAYIFEHFAMTDIQARYRWYSSDVFDPYGPYILNRTITPSILSHITHPRHRTMVLCRKRIIPYTWYCVFPVPYRQHIPYHIHGISHIYFNIPYHQHIYPISHTVFVPYSVYQAAYHNTMYIVPTYYDIATGRYTRRASSLNPRCSSRQRAKQNDR